MQNSKLKFAIVGCGGIATAHMGDFYCSSQQDVTVVACVDPYTPNLQSFGETYGIDAKHRYESLKELLSKKEDIDAVDICTSPDAHVPSIIEAVKAKKHVITEKPFSNNYDDAKNAVIEADKAGVKLMVLQNYRWRSEYVRAKSLINSGWVGKTTLITTASRHDWYAFGTNDYRKKMERMSMFELSIHYIDLFRFLTGSEAKSVFAKTGRKEDSPYIGDTFSVITVEFNNGCLANLITSAETIGAKANWGAETIIQGTHGTIWLNRDNDFEIAAYSHTFGGYMPAEVLVPADGWFGGPLKSFVKSIKTGEEPPTSGKDNLKSIVIISAAYESAEKGIMVNP